MYTLHIHCSLGSRNRLAAATGADSPAVSSVPFPSLSQCVPVRLRGALTPIISKLKTSTMLNIDPLTRPALMKELGVILAKPSRAVPIKEVDTIEVDEDIDVADQMMAEQEMIDMQMREMEAMGNQHKDTYTHTHTHTITDTQSKRQC